MEITTRKKTAFLKCISVRGSTIVGAKSLALNFVLTQVLLMVFKSDKSASVSLG